MSTNNLSGVEKTAVLLTVLGEPAFTHVFGKLGDEEIYRLYQAVNQLGGLDSETINDVLNAFQKELGSFLPSGSKGEEALKSLIQKSLDPSRADLLFKRIENPAATNSIEALKLMDPKMVANLIEKEHPQTISLICSCLDSDQAGKVLSELPEAIHADIIQRISRMAPPSPTILAELENALSEQIESMEIESEEDFDGLQEAALIINAINSELEEKIMESIESEDSELASDIRNKLFTFEDFIKINDSGIQNLLKEVDNQQLQLALKACSEEAADMIYRNLSSRAADMLKEDLEAMGPVKLSEVQAAQQELAMIAKRLESEGQLVIEGAGGDDMLV